ncbi:hypothetical protein [Halobellus rubicundus]|uniref:VCBS repeat-containing protein n=1 Tax=Halobellus rubicundus TaxID=2996466 RepID=A0ABD5MB55_9EURY
MSVNSQLPVSGADSADTEQNGFRLSRRSALRGLAGAGLVSLVGVPAFAGSAAATSANVSLVQSDLSSNITGMGTGPLPGSTAYLTGSPSFVGGDYDAYVSGLASFYGSGGTFSSGSAWIWGSPDGTAAHDEPAGELIRIEETVVLTDLNGPFTLEFAADNLVAAYVNGSLVGTSVDWMVPKKVTLTNLVVGPNTIEIRGMNAGSDADGDGVANDPNPAAVRFELVGPEQPAAIALDIDVKPGNGDETDPINPDARGVIPVVVYSIPDFDAASLDVSTLRFGSAAAVDAGAGASAAHGGHAEDVDGDGLVDLVLHFPSSDAGFAAGDTEAKLVGQTADGTDAVGSDVVRTVGGKGRGRGR